MKISTRILFIATVLIVPLLVIAALPNTIDAAAYLPSHPRPMDGPWQPNNDLLAADLLARGKIRGPEDVDVDAQGNVYAGLADGRIVKIDSQGEVHDFTHTQGRPLGLHFDDSGNLIVADAVKGLLSIDHQGTFSTLVSEVDGIPINFADDLDISRDGTIYFSDASSRYGINSFMLDLLEAKPHGRLLRYDPATQKTTVVLSNLYFANGVALSQNEDFVLVAETSRYRVTRYWLTGPKKGSSDIFIDNLPGFPDGISSNRKGQFWLALATPRNPLMDQLHPYPWIKNLSAKLPKALQPKPIPYGLVVALDENATVLATLHDPSGEHLQEITSVQQVNNKLYLGTLHGDRIGVIALSSEKIRQ